MESGSVGIVKTRYYTFAHPPDEMTLESGRRLGPITLAYETYGRLNSTRSNAILIFHALSGDAHVAGRHHRTDPKPGWWDNMVGPGKAFDTDRYLIICANVIGGCSGSTGPSSIDPKTGKPYGLRFPMVTIKDMVRAQKELLDHLGISQLTAVAGGSMAGMQALQWAVTYPESAAFCIPIATAARQSPQNIAFHEVGRRAIMSDPNWRHGDYYGKEPPVDGLAIARMIGHITYLSDTTLRLKFGRRLQQNQKLSFSLEPEFQVESYIHHKGEAFTKRFDANSYLYISKAIDYFDISSGFGSLEAALRISKSKFLVISFTSDWLYPPSESEELVRALRAANKEVVYYEMPSTYGHDAFLVEGEKMSRIISYYLAHAQEEKLGDFQIGTQPLS
ncbi:homoserine O-acetyltransferase [Candidatus Bathyarchaeota archaeon]|nr:homoserine O-acetyltransferase [Candidatus Bathyarchaeota archaeon]